MTTWLILILSLSLQQAPAAAPREDPFARARVLYDAASYEEALSLLITIEDDSNREQVEEYRALCLLALGRTGEAERALERIVRRTPLYTIEVGDVSPRLVLLFREVRERLLPAVARNLYSRANASFEGARYTLARAQLQELVTLLSTVEPAVGDKSAMLDLRQRAETLLLALAPEKVYGASDQTVSGPIEMSRPTPSFVEVGREGRTGIYQGLIEVVIDETGRVRSATIRRSITPQYDEALLASTKAWRFHPAMFRGVPVSYRKTFEIIVHSR